MKRPTGARSAASPKLILHVGLHKTGTTSIQRSLAQARPRLAAAGVLYPAFAANHSVAFYSAFSDAGTRHFQHRLAGRSTADAISTFATKRLDAFDAELGRSTADTVVISGEGISRLSEAETQTLLQWLQPRFDTVTVVVFVRPPESLLHSRIQQQARTGKTLAALGGRDIRTHYREELEKYVRLLPREALRPRIFARDTLIDGCVVQTFMDATGLAGRIPNLDVIRANESMSCAGADLLFTANLLLPVFLPDGTPNPQRAGTLTRTLMREPGAKFHAPRDLVRRAVEASREDVRWLDAAFGIDIRAHDIQGLSDADYYPGLPTGAAAERLRSEVTERNAALLQAGPDPELAARRDRKALGGQRRTEPGRRGAP